MLNSQVRLNKKYELTMYYVLALLIGFLSTAVEKRVE